MEDSGEGILDSVSLANIEVQDTGAISSNDIIEKPDPLMESVEWSDFVLKQFAEDEMIDGNPTVDGLRRVARLLLGRILESTSKVVQAPNMANNNSATVEHSVVIFWTRETDSAFEARFTEVADVNELNTDPEFRRFASSTASTRAEARAFRKALMLKRVVAAEEITEVPPDNLENPGKITSQQINFLDNICKRIDINVLSYIGLSKNKYDDIKDVPYAIAVKMVGVLSGWQRDTTKIPPHIKGYKEWRK